MAPRLTTDAKLWRDRAGEARATAERMTDPQAKPIMLAIATGYERLAMRDEERQTAKKIPLRRTRYTHDLNGTDLRGGLASSVVGGGRADCPSNIRPNTSW